MGDRFLLPIPDLTVPRDWQVGQVLICPSTRADELLADHPPMRTEGDQIADRLVEVMNSAPSIAVVPASSIDAAVDIVRVALDALRLLQLSMTVTRVTSFGLPGDILEAQIPYVSQAAGTSTLGGIFRGMSRGWTFGESALTTWQSSEAFQFLSQALANPTQSLAAGKAVAGLTFFGRAAREHNPDLKLFGPVAALEAWLLNRMSRAQANRFARYVTWFGCGDDESRCGRGRAMCPYLWLDPEHHGTRIKALESLGRDEVLGTWTCTEWLRCRDWYTWRSNVAHGVPNEVTREDADEAEYWITHNLALPILDWLSRHSADPVGDLERTIAAVTPPPSALALNQVLDAGTRPLVPPGYEMSGDGEGRRTQNPRRRTT